MKQTVGHRSNMVKPSYRNTSSGIEKPDKKDMKCMAQQKQITPRQETKLSHMRLHRRTLYREVSPYGSCKDLLWTLRQAGPRREQGGQHTITAESLSLGCVNAEEKTSVFKIHTFTTIKQNKHNYIKIDEAKLVDSEVLEIRGSQRPALMWGHGFATTWCRSQRLEILPVPKSSEPFGSRRSSPGNRRFERGAVQPHPQIPGEHQDSPLP